MRARIKVTDLSPAQWAWLDQNLGTVERAPGDVRMCVELDDDQIPVHIELAPRAFIALIERLAQVGQSPGEIRYGPDTGHEGMTPAEVEAEAAAEMRDRAL